MRSKRQKVPSSQDLTSERQVRRNNVGIAPARLTGDPRDNNAPCQFRSRRTVCLVGAGWRFTSGISYYTCRLANALANDHNVNVIQMRQLLPRRLYPGAERVGQPRARMAYRPDVSVYDGVDWWWGRSLIRALSFMASRRPDVLVLQWWTATVLHTYLVLAIAARLGGRCVVLELHELQDTGEGRFKIARWYGRWGLGMLVRLCQGCVVHSTADLKMLEAGYSLRNVRTAIARHGPFDQYDATIKHLDSDEKAISIVRRAPRPSVINLLFFGTIRPYKGLENLLDVFNGLTVDEVSNLWLTIVGETWEGCTEPARLVATSPHREHITFVNYYVPDEVVAAAFAHADVVVLPYHRSSSSGPLQVAMSWGLPIVVTHVGGLPEAATDYDGAVFIPPDDRSALKSAIMEAAQMTGRRFADPRSWTESIDALFLASGLPAAETRLRKTPT